MSVLEDAMEGLDQDGLAALVACASAVGSADGRFDPTEKRTLLQLLGEHGLDRDAAQEALDGVLESLDGLSAADAVGVGYPSDRYMELLGEGMQLV
jgi:hypothetical protein